MKWIEIKAHGIFCVESLYKSVHMQRFCVFIVRESAVKKNHAHLIEIQSHECVFNNKMSEMK